MRMLQNFTIRIVLLVILGIFGLLWSGVTKLMNDVRAVAAGEKR